MQRVAVAVGVANQRSLAWKSALAMLQGEFDHVIVTYQNERFQASVDKMVQQQNAIYFHQYQQFQQFQQQQQYKQLDELLVPLKRISSLPLDISQEEEVQTLFQERIPSLLQSFNDTNTNTNTNIDTNHPMDHIMNPQIDAVVHSVAYAPPSAMKSSQESPLLHTDKESFQTSHSLSSYSLITLARHALPLLSCQNDNYDTDNDSHQHQHQRKHQRQRRSPSITTMTYLGSTRSVPNYNIMGPAKASLESLVRGLAMEVSKPPHNIRVNAISAGPINTLAARGIKDFNELKNEVDERSMIQRGIVAEEVGDVVAFVAGSKASGVTGQVWFVDGGYSSLG